MRFIPTLLAALLAAGVGSVAMADTADVKTQTIVEVKKKGAHCEQDPNCFNRYHPAIKPVARAKPGDLIVVHTRDALDSNLNINSKPKDVTAIDVNLIHPMTDRCQVFVFQCVASWVRLVFCQASRKSTSGWHVKHNWAQRAV
ncbi:MAG: acetamidase/formamidase family protein [Oxalobacteraceae bacterium]|nr:acetamidase/formamidase family protein [Oxalobacteraceae bacterium]